MPKNATKSGLLKARVETELHNFFTNLASLRRLDVADIIREAFWEYKERSQRTYGKRVRRPH